MHSPGPQSFDFQSLHGADAIAIYPVNRIDRYDRLLLRLESCAGGERVVALAMFARCKPCAQISLRFGRNLNALPSGAGFDNTGYNNKAGARVCQ